MLRPHLNQQDTGQTLVLFVFAAIGLVALAALLIDGGSIYLNRRRAQTAADALALYAAHQRCIQNESDMDVQNDVTNWAALQYPSASVDPITFSPDSQNPKLQTVNVATTIETPSYFASILGQRNDTARAQASARCFIPNTTKHLLPIAWTCRPPLGANWEDTCDTHAIPIDTFKAIRQQLGDPWFSNGTAAPPHLLTEPNTAGSTNASEYTDLSDPRKMVYIVVDDDTFDYTQCNDIPQVRDPSDPTTWTATNGGTINCDFNGDGQPDLFGGSGERGWLSLTGQPGAAPLIQLLSGGYAGAITMPQWFQGQPGTINSVYIQAHAIAFQLSVVPVFNAVCHAYPTSAGCADDNGVQYYQPGDAISSIQGNGTWYRVPGFAEFVVTCVSKGTSEDCPAKDYAGVKQNTSTMEGYFISGVAAGSEVDPNGFDLGVYVISLTR